MTADPSRGGAVLALLILSACEPSQPPPSDPDYWTKMTCAQPRYQQLGKCIALRKREPQP